MKGVARALKPTAVFYANSQMLLGGYRAFHELRLAVPPGTDPLEILDAARAAGRVLDFGLDLPTLSQLFLAAADGQDRPEVVR